VPRHRDTVNAEEGTVSRPIGPEIDKSALIIVDMQNDFVHPDGGFAHLAREHPDTRIDMPFLMSTIPHVKRLAEGFRRAGRPVVYVTQVLRADYSDAAFPFWRSTKGSTTGNRTFIVEGSWGALIVDELKPAPSDHSVVKKGFGGFANTPLDTILRNLGVNTCVVAGVTTCVCVSTTIRQGVEYNYRMILVSDAVAEVHRDTHEAELKTMSRMFADVQTTDEVIALLAQADQVIE
jgi:nicotinamidase-related amidase